MPETPYDHGMTQAELIEIRDGLEKLVPCGVLDYVLCSQPLGKEWILGAGTLLKVDTPGAIAFLAGTTVVTERVVRRMAERLDIFLPPTPFSEHERFLRNTASSTHICPNTGNGEQ